MIRDEFTLPFTVKLIAGEEKTDPICVKSVCECVFVNTCVCVSVRQIERERELRSAFCVF